ncbi:hypothetical protein DFJ43DRAFT_461619 [Lentinula guzmanii]|uniref:VIT-domain-containing protein n=1 Tax=Lentinula guzmanii TaxID=2804957 RepID=A0AA38MYH5_9AGAR|nr:hypothetical protein DFJ43DRAFT_461619 [Lentinula guzmanii]
MTRCSTRPPPPSATPQPPSPPSSRPPVANPPARPPSSTLPLVLKECSIKVWIVDVHSWVTISQQFQNPSSSVAEHVAYTFSMLAGAAVYGFELIRQDGTKIDGLIKEKNQAQKEMSAAINEGHTAALGEEVTKDVFSIGIGNVQGNETITIKLSYMSPLTDDEENNQLRFTLPRSYMERYGKRPDGVKSARLTHENVPFTIDVLIQQRGRVRAVTSPSGYNFTVGLGRPPGIDASGGIPDSHFATATVRRTAYSTGRSRDVIIIINADRLDNPRAFIESHQSPNHSTAAIGLTLVPQFNINFCPAMEYIVLVDRSGSMEGVKLEMTRQALIVLLQGLPSRGSYFNIFSYGSRVTSLWPRSRSYDQATVDEARRHLDSMQANYGGTEMAGALDAVFASLPSRLTRPVSIFLLTDGGVWGSILQNCVAKVEKAITDRTSDNAFMRVFTIGIGNGVSTETCDRIARAGGGTATYIVADNEQFIGKCTRLVRAARTPPIVDIKVTWVTPQQNSQHDATGQVINLFDPDADQDCGDLGPLAPIMQAPGMIPSFYRSTRTQVYAIVPNSIAVSHELKLTGRIPVTGACVELTIPLQRFCPFPTGTAFLHTLAAKALIQDREDIEQGGGGNAKELQAEIIRLGITYKLTSRYTSLLAVDRRSRDVLGIGGQRGAVSPRARKAVAPIAAARHSLPISFSMINARSFTSSVMDSAEALIMFARLQKFDGGFDTSSTAEIEAALALDASEGSEGANALGVVKSFITDTKYGPEIVQQVYATLLAWAYMSTRCKDEAYDMKEKAYIWLRENLDSGVDVDELKRQFLEAVSLEIHVPDNEFVDSDDSDEEEEEE